MNSANIPFEPHVSPHCFVVLPRLHFPDSGPIRPWILLIPISHRQQRHQLATTTTTTMTTMTTKPNLLFPTTLRLRVLLVHQHHILLGVDNGHRMAHFSAPPACIDSQPAIVLAHSLLRTSTLRMQTILPTPGNSGLMPMFAQIASG